MSHTGHPSHVVIIGAGFSGTALAIELLRDQGTPVEVTLVESRPSAGQGLAYGTSEDFHLLNATNSASSVVADDSEHFIRWLRDTDRPHGSEQFSSRRAYSLYLQHSLDDAALAAVNWGNTLRTRLGRRATDAARGADGFRVWLDDGEAIDCSHLVLATGYGTPADPLAAWLPIDCGRYLRNPWGTTVARIPRNDSVLLLGTGLTMVDVALGLRRQGHQGPVHALSRRGLAPRAHSMPGAALPFGLRQQLYSDLSHGDLRGALRAVRETIAAAELHGLGWQTVIDALRPLSPGIWNSLRPVERHRFLRHLRPWFDAHRHRLPPEQTALLAAMMNDGRLQLRAGRLTGATDCGDMLMIEHQPRGQPQTRRDPYRWVINCTGATLSGVNRHSLEGRLMEQGLLTADEYGLGFCCDTDGTVRGRHGVVRRLHLIGPACRSQSFDHTAIAELRRQATLLAQRIVHQWRPASNVTWMPRAARDVGAPAIPWQRRRIAAGPLSQS